MLLPPRSPPCLSRTALYRLFLQHLRLVPDPQVWATAVPRVRKLLSTPGPPPTAPPEDGEERAKWESIRSWRAERAMKKANKVRSTQTAVSGRLTSRVFQELSQLRAAVACHPHALLRLIERSYYQRGASRWDRLRSILIQSNPSSPPLDTRSTPIPSPLRPLMPRQPGPSDPIVRARAAIPERRRENKKTKLHERNWNLLKAPIYLPDPRPGLGQGRERERAKVENMRILAGISEGLITTLDLPPHIARIVPNLGSRRKLPLEPYPPPRPSHTKQNPSTWKLPREFTGRLRERVYRRVWYSLPWVRPVSEGGAWKSCAWAEVQAWEQGVMDKDLTSSETREKSAGKKGRKAAKVNQASEDRDLDPRKWPHATDRDYQWLSRDFSEAVGQQPM
ncbi:hypothetical protein L202_07923 [Cryptococcus amylolentus CBS 6039]|uniref:Uncharacterized protein n=1 Tax=Cryptococcus amylolentus CBS 6039 TaxID=1295533 RepID=A0A1E3HAR2_9TREE|nr:hypothetical protein L202_07923 [Cryptococcus amylolentus CBS 6039]ODN73394.1 hypothetical protein L202_07923 [Cryptococcus amylolentus CBS 6039]